MDGYSHKPRMGILPSHVREELLEAVRAFARDTRNFDRTLELEALVQALRNYVVYIMLCLASGKKKLVSSWNLGL